MMTVFVVLHEGAYGWFGPRVFSTREKAASYISDSDRNCAIHEEIVDEDLGDSK